jgi:tetratricopeptide (TPR) repeat protein
MALFFLSYIKKATSMKLFQYLFVSLLLGATACKEPEKPVTKKEAAVLAESIVKSVAKKDNSIYNNAVDIDLLIAKTKALQPNKSSSYWREVGKGLKSAGNFGDKVIQALGKGGSYSLVKQYEKQGKQHLLFRLYSDEGLNYHDAELVNKNGKTKITDIYIYATGEYFSETLNTLSLYMDDAKDEAASYKLQEVTRINKLLQEGQYQSAKDIIDGLPINMQALKVMQIYNIITCSHLGDSLHQDAISKFERDFPNDPALNLVLIDGYFLKKEYAKALETINKLDRQIDKDPFLDYQRGLIYNMMGKKGEAFEALQQLYRNMPEFSAGGVELSTYYMDKGDYEKAAEIIRRIKQNRDYDDAIVQNLYLLYPKLKPLVEK